MEETEDLEETKKEDAIIILILNRVTELGFESILEYDLVVLLLERARSHRNRVCALVWSDGGSCSLKVLVLEISNDSIQFIYRERNKITRLPTCIFLIHREK